MKKTFLAAWMALALVTNAWSDSIDLSQPNLMQSEIKHLVILMLENRSFDNLLAWLYDQEHQPSSFIPENANQAFFGLSEDALDQYSNVLVNSKGEIVCRCPPIKGAKSVKNIKFLNSPKYDPNETFPHVMKQIFGNDQSSEPSMIGFLQDYASQWWENEWEEEIGDICAVMETYTENELPFFYALARKYAVSDLWFSSVPTQTNPNRAFSMCGSSEGEIINGSLGKSNFISDTLWNRLSDESPNTSWTIFWQSDMLPGIIPGPFHGPNNFWALTRIPSLQDHFKTIDQFHDLARRGQLPDISFIEPQWTLSLNLSPAANTYKSLFEGHDLLVGFQGNDMHPPGDVRSTENLLSNIYTSISSNPDAWNKTLFVILFDEHGGIFDHVPPPKALPPNDQCQNGFAFDRYGVRIPALFISPKIQQGTIIRSGDPAIPFDHTSLISTIFTWKNIDKNRWNMGKRTDAAPTFDAVVKMTEPRNDVVVISESIPVPAIDDENVIQMGDKFCLRDRFGNYLIYPDGWQRACLGSPQEKAIFEFGGGIGKITSGSFVTVNIHLAGQDAPYLLETLLGPYTCIYDKPKHKPGQWWTIKNVDNPFTGLKIQYGDKVYLENHIYIDLLLYVPGRLAKDNYYKKYLTTRAIIENDSFDDYWIIEKP